MKAAASMPMHPRRPSLLASPIRAACCAGALALGLASPCVAQPKAEPQAEPPVAVQIEADLGQPAGPLHPVWRFFGADEPNYALMRDGQTLLSHLGALQPGSVFFRTHNLLNTGDGSPQFKWGSTNIYTEDANGNPVYDWSIVDRIIDSYQSRGVLPYLQLGFMPQALASADPAQPYQHRWRPGFAYDLIAAGWNSPPKDYKKWGELVFQWTRHNVERYGADQVSKWYFETWNEANLPSYWSGSAEDFFKLHDYTVDAIRRALPAARVGGPDLARAGGDMMNAFLAHVSGGTNFATGQTGTPTDFLSFHAKGQPEFIDDHVRMGIATHLKWAHDGFARIAAVPQMAGKPVVLGESDPEGCAACPGPQNAYRNGTLYASYTVESIARLMELARRDRINLDGVITWAFEFEEQPYFAGYRQLASQGIDLPVMNAFRLLSMMGDTRVAASSDAELPLDAVMNQGVRGAPDIGTLASRDASGKATVLIWHYHDDDVAGPDAQIHLTVSGLQEAKSGKLVQWQVDKTHANAFTAWQAMGSPQSPDEKQYATLLAAAALKPTEPRTVSVRGGRAAVDVTVPRQGVTLVVLDPG